MGYYKEKEEYEKENFNNKTSINKCPKCKKGQMVVAVTPKISFFGGGKIIFKSFCPLCGYAIKKEV